MTPGGNAYVVLVTGSRNWTDRNRLFVALSIQCVDSDRIIIRHGAAPGADTLADEFAKRHPRCEPDANPADWGRECDEKCFHRPRHRPNGDRYCPMAGHYRNQLMVDKWPKPDVCLAFPLGRSTGTRDCMKRAEAAGIPVINCGDK